jgi:hypothetical protein
MCLYSDRRYNETEVSFIEVAERRHGLPDFRVHSKDSPMIHTIDGRLQRGSILTCPYALLFLLPPSRRVHAGVLSVFIFGQGM